MVSESNPSGFLSTRRTIVASTRRTLASCTLPVTMSDSSDGRRLSSITQASSRNVRALVCSSSVSGRQRDSMSFKDVGLIAYHPFREHRNLLAHMDWSPRSASGFSRGLGLDLRAVVGAVAVRHLQRWDRALSLDAERRCDWVAAPSGAPIHHSPRDA